MPETDTKTDEAGEYTKKALMRIKKPELIAIAGEIGVDLTVLPKLTKDAISDAIMVFLEPPPDSKVSDDTKTEEARTFTKSALMCMAKPELIAVAGEIGVDLGVLPKLTKDSISDAIMVFLEPRQDYDEEVGTPSEPTVSAADEEIELEELETDPVEPIVIVSDEEIELEELRESEVIPMPQETEVAPELPPTIIQETYQDILRPHTKEKSVRVRRIEESSK